MTLQVDERRVATMPAPRDRAEVLIKEVRQQTRRRRSRNVALVVVAIVITSTIYLLASSNGGTPGGASRSLAPGLPAGLTSAINKTLSVRSVEIIESDDPGPAIYQAPGLYAAPQWSPPGHWATWYISGDAEFYAVPRNSGQALVRQFPRMSLVDKDGRSPAAQTAFQALLDYLPFATRFDAGFGDTYTFHISVPRGDSNITPYTSGKISLSKGFVTSVILTYRRPAYTDFSSGVGVVVRAAIERLTTRYLRFDGSPHLVAPNLKRPWCLQPTGSLRLSHCISGWVA